MTGRQISIGRRAGLVAVMFALLIACGSFSKAYAAIYETEPNDEFDTANLITVGQTVYGEYNESGVKDFYRVDLPASGTLSITFANDKYFTAMFGCDFYLRIYNQYYEEVDYIRVYGATTRPATLTLNLEKGANYLRFSHDEWTNSPSEGHPYHFSLSYVVGGTAISKITGAKKAFKMKWARQSGASKYQIRFSTKRNMAGARVIDISAKKKSKKVGGLKTKKKYYVQMRVVKDIGGTKYFSQWSKKKSVKTK